MTIVLIIDLSGIYIVGVSQQMFSCCFCESSYLLCADYNMNGGDLVSTSATQHVFC